MDLISGHLNEHKMKIFLLSVLLACIVASAIGDGCTIYGQQVKAGEKFSPKGQCSEFTCKEDGNTYSLGCAGVAGGPGCKLIPEDPSKPYPDCCKNYEY